MAGPQEAGEEPPFRRIGPDVPASPLLLSVPHAGRRYSEALLAAARVGPDQLRILEDRLVDRLIWRAVAAGATAIVADVPRAEIDLNRDEREMDPLAMEPPVAPGAFFQSNRTRSGLGLVPSRIPAAGAIWRRRLTGAELTRRVESIHRPFHEAVARLMEERRAMFGVAILLDCHSMPPRGTREKVVIGDRHGTSAGTFYRDAALQAVRQQGFGVAINQPYAGGHITAVHGRPMEGFHALQIEIDRSLYLDPSLSEPGPGFDRVARLIEAVSAALHDAAPGRPDALAAE
jgi:N-formylglutamate amidohydrolase